MPDMTTKASVVTQAVYDVIEPHRIALAAVLPNDVAEAPADGAQLFYGDQAKIPFTPAICVFSGPKSRERSGLRWRNEFIVIIQCYVGRLQKTEITREQVELFGEAVEDVIHTSPTLTNTMSNGNGVVVDGYVRSSEAGYSANRMFQVVRLTWTGFTQTHGL